MLSTLICVGALGARQAPAEGPIPARVSYRIKVYDRTGLVSAPKVLTLDGQSATIDQKTASREIEVVVLPHVGSGRNRLTTELHLSLDGCPSLTTVFGGDSDSASFIKIAKTKVGKSIMLTSSLTSQKPRTSRDDLLVVVIGTVQAPPGSDPFTAPTNPRQPGAPAPAPVLYQVTVRDSKGVVSAPTIRTLDSCVARMESSGNLGTVSIALLPRLQPSGNLFTMLDFKVDGDEVSRVARSDKPGTPRFYKLWKEDAATPHLTPLASSRSAHLKPGEWLIQVTGSLPSRD